jgi:hypothetical protein
MKRALLMVALLATCRRGADVGGPPDASTQAAVSDATSRAQGEAVLAARCRSTGQGVALEEQGGPDDLEIGDGLAYADGYAVSFVHSTRGAGPVAAIVLLDSEAGGARIVDLGKTLGDAPPPRLALCRNELVAAALGRAGVDLHREGGADGQRDLTVYLVNRPMAERTALVIRQHRDESMAIDLACAGGAGLAVWDETTAGVRAGSARGVVRGARFEIGQRAVRTLDVSPAESDAETPRVVRAGSGFFVVWLARRPESPPPSGGATMTPPPSGGATMSPPPSGGATMTPPQSSDASAAIEATGEARAYGWLEMLALDADANPVGTVRRLTSATGHVSAYDVESRFDALDLGSRGEGEVWLVARDDGEAADGAGGVLLRVRARAGGAEAPVVVPTDGLGRGAPAFVEGREPWLAWVGPHERLRLLPLDRSGESVAAPSAEDGLDEARPLLSHVAGGMLVAAPSGVPQLRVFNCQR